MIPIVTPSEMAAIDALHADRLDDLIERAGSAVARAAVDMLGGTYGRRVVVVAGKGNNGNDGRVAARRLRQRGVRVTEVAPDHRGELVGDLVIDAAYGSGLSRNYVAPAVAAGTPVLAVDIPSGIDGFTGVCRGEPMKASRTVTFAALKPGLLFLPGSAYAGAVEVVDIGIDLDSSLEQIGSPHRAGLVVGSDLANAWIDRPTDAHKWQAATWIVGGSAGMTGAAQLAVRGAQRCGAGYVRVSVPGAGLSSGGRGGMPIEAVGWELPAEGWGEAVLQDCDRFRSIVIGPGLGRAAATRGAVHELVSRSPVPLVVDADALHVLDGVTFPDHAPTKMAVLTPHDGEFAALTGYRPGVDRIAAARELAAARKCVVLLKGAATVVAEPNGAVYCVTSGDQRLATAGTGDVLAGMIGALIASGHRPAIAAAFAAYMHGRAAKLTPHVGMVAGDLAQAIPRAVDETLRLRSEEPFSKEENR